MVICDKGLKTDICIRILGHIGMATATHALGRLHKLLPIGKRGVVIVCIDREKFVDTFDHAIGVSEDESWRSTWTNH